VTIDKDRVFEIIKMNKKGEKPLKLTVETEEKSGNNGAYPGDILGDQSITRFDGQGENQGRRRRKPRKKRPDNFSENRKPRKENLRVRTKSNII
jgi:hypothetical protein